MKNASIVHLIYGPTAAGKSTYAKKLAAECNAVRFAIDEWMHTLYSPDQPASMSMEWVMSRVARCQSKIWATSQRILATGTDVVLELGLLREQDRDRMQATVEAAGHTATFSFVDASFQTRKQRVLRRNNEKGDTYSFDVTPAMFNAMKAYFERPAPKELARSCIIITDPNHG